MYQRAYNKNGQLAHSTECQKAFSRLDDNCHRCAELKAGAKPRQGWQASYYASKSLEIDSIHNHDCKKSGCAPVCTFSEW